MNPTAVIGLLTDFGLQDIYVGVMHGAIAAVNSSISVIDITHQIPAQNIAAGRYCLMSAYPYFPAGTVFIAVVDPGVGSKRRAIAVQFGDRYVICPDNGIISGILEFNQPLAAVELNNSRYWRSLEPSTTFHGRDIFAPAGAHLASGVPLPELGTKIDPSSLVTLPIPEWRIDAIGIDGVVQYIDIFGNVITNIPKRAVEGRTWRLEVEGKKIPASNSYSDVVAGDAVAIVGSHGWLEIAVNCGNAASKLGISWGDRLQVILEDK